MRLVQSLLAWIDKDWEKRRYNPIWAFAQRLLWSVPLLVAILAMALLEAFGVSSNAPILIGIFIAGAVGTLFMMGLSIYRWMAGYSRTEWQDKAAEEYRKRGAARGWLHFLLGR